MKKTFLKEVALGAGLLCLAATSVFASGFISENVTANETAPDFTLSDINGQMVSLKDYRGKGVILFFFTTWCPHCQDKLLMLASEHEKIKREGFEILAVDPDERESDVKLRAYARKHNAAFKILLDHQMKAARAYDVRGVPKIVLINKKGLVVFEGDHFPDDYKKLLDRQF